MLHTKAQCHWSLGSGEIDFWRVLPYMGVAAILIMWPRSRYPNKLSFPRPMEAAHEIWLRLAQQFRRRRSLKMVDGQTTDDDRRSMPILTVYSSFSVLYYKVVVTTATTNSHEMGKSPFEYFRVFCCYWNNIFFSMFTPEEAIVQCSWTLMSLKAEVS